MSRVGKAPISIPQNVQVTLNSGVLIVKGPLGELSLTLSEYIDITVEDGKITVKAKSDIKQARAMHGTTRAIINNMIIGVSKGFERKLLLVGVGYRAKADGNGSKLKLELGFSHDIEEVMPTGVSVTTPTQTEIIIKGYDRQKVGQVAANLRNNYRPPEPYKGKGIRYAEEHVVIKETKKK
jgi:large subunit ribosomal protein L6